MKIVIPAAGQGTRLRPHTHTRPKVMLPVAGRPILGHILADVADLGAADVTIVVGYRGEAVEAYVRETFPDLPVRFVRQEPQLGLGHAVLVALGEGDRGPVLVVLGDTVFDVDYHRIVEGTRDVLGVRSVPDPERFGIVELDDSGERVVRLVEKPAEPRSDLALVGLYYVRDAGALRSAIAGLVDAEATTRGEYQLTDALQRLIDDGVEFAPFEIGEWYDCGKPETLLDTNRVLLERDPPEVPEGVRGPTATIVPPVYVAEGCEIERSVVGPHVSLMPGATLRDAVVRDAIVFEEASIEGAVVERAIVGRRSRVRGRPARASIGDDAAVET